MEIHSKSASIYIHIPFCARKCPYCSFPVVVAGVAVHGEYLSALEREMQAYGQRAAATVYVGGGTPSIMNEGNIARLSSMIMPFCSSGRQEWTFELNPESVTPAKAGFILSSGFTRASLGLQSFNAGYLSYLGRGHRVQEGVRAYQALREAGFDNINVDLMFGFPGQTIEQLDQDIDALLALESEHVSLYALNVEDKSVFCVRGEKVSEELQADLYRRVCARLNAAGIMQYEVSNFARPGFESVHNINYWQGGEYRGFGMGAHSHIDGARFWNADTLPKYLKMMREGVSAQVGREKLSPPEKMMETFLFGLRMNEGVDISALEARFEMRLGHEKVSLIEGFVRDGFLMRKGARVAATDKGRLVLDELSARLI